MTGFMPFSCDESRAECAHDSGDVRSHARTAGDALKAPQHRVVVEGAALHDDIFSELARVGELDNLKQCVFDNGVGETGGNIRDGGALLLCLLYFGIHKHRAARAEVNRVLGKQSFPREILHGIV